LPGAASRIDLFLSDKRSRETVWLDSNHNQKFDTGETIVYPSDATLDDATPGRIGLLPDWGNWRTTYER